MAIKEFHILIFRIYEYVRLPDKGKLRLQMDLRLLIR